MARLVRLTVAIAVAAALLPAAAAAQAPACEAVAPYPGDAAPRTAIAQWMAHGAAAASLPRELPVMGALVESGLRNLAAGDSDAVGYFQMRTTIWDKGDYAGYPQNPSLQLKWFVDRATQERAQWIAAGRPDPVSDERVWGEWIADVLTPAENRRHLYQERLLEARALAGAPCVAAPPPPAPPVPPPALPALPAMPAPPADTVAPLARITGAGTQRALRRGSFVLGVRCPAERCTTSAIATIALPRARRPLRIVLKARTMAAGSTRRLRFVLSRSARTRLRARSSVKASVRITIRDLAGNRVVRKRAVKLTR